MWKCSFDVGFHILNILRHSLFSVAQSDCPPLFPHLWDSWQCHPGLSYHPWCCCWIIIIWVLPPRIFPFLLFVFCWSQDQICCRGLRHPSHPAVMFHKRMGSLSADIMLLLHMCRYARGGHMRSSRSEIGNEFLQRPSSLTPLRCVVILSIFKQVVPSECYNWEPQRRGENSMWDELILPAFIPCLFRAPLISASAFTACTGSIYFTEEERGRLGMRREWGDKKQGVFLNMSCLNYWDPSLKSGQSQGKIKVNKGTIAYEA